MVGSYGGLRKVQNGVEPFLFIKVKKSSPRWELWFLFVVAQVEVKLERMDHSDSDALVIPGVQLLRQSNSYP